MEHNSRLHSSDCVRLGRPCVDLSWEHLNHTRKECQAMIDEDQKEPARICSTHTGSLRSESLTETPRFRSAGSRVSQNQQFRIARLLQSASVRCTQLIR